MRWTKLGRIFHVDQNHPWMYSHAANPVVEWLRDDVVRVYFSCRDRQSRSHIGYAEIRITPPFEALEISETPILAPGETGAFDDSGVSLACITEMPGARHLYYVGWNLGVTVPWRNSIGLAIAKPGTHSFKRYSKAPLLDRSDADPFSVSYPYVLDDDAGYGMWYGSNLSWGKEQKEMFHVIKYAHSNDGLDWQRKGEIAIDLKDEHEYAISRPCVIKDGALYKMWYSYRGQSYRIGYAESEDGINWIRKDEDAGIDVSESDWDSEMIEYPFIFDHGGERYMFYNGNGYGKTGIGLAVLTTNGTR